jgi:hypothetical protein
MTAKDKLRQAVEELSELEAEQALAFIARRQEQDPVREFFDNAPEEDEPLTPAERASVDEAWAQRGDSASLAELRREFDCPPAGASRLEHPPDATCADSIHLFATACSMRSNASSPTRPRATSSGSRDARNTDCASATGA